MITKPIKYIEIIFPGSSSVLGAIVKTLAKTEVSDELEISRLLEFRAVDMNCYCWVIATDYMGFGMIDAECI